MANPWSKNPNGDSARGPSAGPIGNLKAKPFDHNSTTGGTASPWSQNPNGDSARGPSVGPLGSLKAKPFDKNKIDGKM